MPWTFYTAFIGTFLSVTGLSYLAWREHNPSHPQTLSQLAAKSSGLQMYFRMVLWVCGTLFAITVFFFINPRLTNSVLQTAAFILVFVPELLLVIFHAKGGTELLLHDVLSRVMGFGMWATALMFAVNLSGVYQQIELFLTVILSGLAILTIIDKKKFLLYELPFIYTSHLSILVAAIAVR
jgi:hypothetical protein